MINIYVRAREENAHVDFEAISLMSKPRAQLAKHPPLDKDWKTKSFTIYN